MQSTCIGRRLSPPIPSISQTLPADTATGVRFNYETSMLRSPGELSFDLSMLNIADGSHACPLRWSTLGVMSPRSSLRLGRTRETIQNGAAIAMINVDTLNVPLHTEMNQANREWPDYDGLHPLIIRPMAPLDFSGRYAVVLTNELTDLSRNPCPVQPHLTRYAMERSPQMSGLNRFERTMKDCLRD